jgi:hypothetical protein
LRDPSEFMGIADSYRCFLDTLREYTAVYTRRAAAEAEAERAAREVVGGATP